MSRKDTELYIAPSMDRNFSINTFKESTIVRMDDVDSRKGTEVNIVDKEEEHKQLLNMRK
jgi:hypothetical protein